MNKIVLCLIMMAIVCWVGIFATDPRPLSENMVPFVSGFILLLGAIVLEAFTGYQMNIKELQDELQRCIDEHELQHERQWVYEPKEEDDLIQEVSFSKPVSIQSFVEREKMGKIWHDNYMRANEMKRNCGKKPYYKDHHRKEGVKRKEMFACWNM